MTPLLLNVVRTRNKISSASLDKNINNEKYDIQMEELMSKSHFDMYKNETFSQAGSILILERNPTKYFANIYIPTILLTVSSFIGFLIPVGAEEGRRMALLVTIFLMLVTLSGTVQEKAPIVCLKWTFVSQSLFYT